MYQDVFLRLLDQDSTHWDGDHLRAWLLRCTVNRCNDLHRFRLRRPVLALADLPETAAEPDSGAAELWDAVARLPEKLRIPIHLYYAEGYSTEEIAGLLDIPRTAGYSGGHGPHPAPPGPEPTERHAGRRRP